MSSFFLTSKRLGFRWWTREDIELARRLWGDPAVTRLFSRLPLTTEQIEQRLNAELERAEKHHIQYWPMFELGTGKHIGCWENY